MSTAPSHIEFLSDLRSEILRSGWPSIVGRATTCRGCGSVLDCRRAGDITIKVDGKARFARVLCSKCFDRVLDNVRTLTPEGIAAAVNCDPTSTVTVEVIDGRVVMGGAR